MKLYVSGPVTGMPNRNREAFERAARILNAAIGCPVEIPHDTVPPDADWNAAMRMSLRAMLACDGVAFLPGWQRSRGSRIERDTALAVDIPTGTVEWWEATGGGLHVR